jgi:hypothetical protein
LIGRDGGREGGKEGKAYLRLGLGAILLILGGGGRVVLVALIVPAGVRAVVCPGPHADPAELELALSAGHVVAALGRGRREGGRAGKGE